MHGSQRPPPARNIGGRFYSAVKVDLAKGKRWFCSSEEAEAAGCRRSKL
jgi:hypothetical protein